MAHGKHTGNDAHHKFHKGAALKKHGHSGLQHHGKSKGGKLIATPTNVMALGHKNG